MWSGLTTVQGNCYCRDILLKTIEGQRPTVLAVGVGGGCLDIFLLSVTALFYLPLAGRWHDI